MKRLGFIMAMVVMLGGCMPSRAFVTAVDGHLGVILPEYRAYVSGDESLEPDSKRIRLESADSLDALVDTALEANP